MNKMIKSNLIINIIILWIIIGVTGLFIWFVFYEKPANPMKTVVVNKHYEPKQQNKIDKK